MNKNTKLETIREVVCPPLNLAFMVLVKMNQSSIFNSLIIILLVGVSFNIILLFCNKRFEYITKLVVVYKCQWIHNIFISFMLSWHTIGWKACSTVFHPWWRLCRRLWWSILSWKWFYYGTSCHSCDNKLQTWTIWLSITRFGRIFWKYGLERSTTCVEMGQREYWTIRWW